MPVMSVFLLFIKDIYNLPPFNDFLNFIFHFQIKFLSFFLCFGGNQSQNLSSQNLISSANFIRFNYSLFQISLNGAFTYFQKIARLFGCINFVWFYFRHKLKMTPHRSEEHTSEL